MSKFEIQQYLGFKFVNAGAFYLADLPWEGVSKGRKWQVFTSIELTSEKFRFANETACLIISEGKVKYVGEYSYNLSERMLKGNYIDHHKDTQIENELKQGKYVSLWLAIDPYAVTPDNKKINIAKSIEQEFLRRYDLDWNNRGKIKKWESWRAEKCIPVSEIIQPQDR